MSKSCPVGYSNWAEKSTREGRRKMQSALHDMWLINITTTVLYPWLCPTNTSL